MMPARLHEEIAAWLEFYRDLDIDEFLLESRPVRITLDSQGGLGVAGSEQLEGQPEAVTQAPDQSERESDRVAPILAAQASPPTPEIADAATVRPPRAARSLNLFEAQPPRRPDRETLEEIRTDLGECQRCKLAGGRKHIVFGQGDPHAELL